MRTMRRVLPLLGISLILAGCPEEMLLELTLTNQAPVHQVDAPYLVPLERLTADASQTHQSLLVLAGTDTLPYQVISRSESGDAGELLILLDMASGASRSIVIKTLPPDEEWHPSSRVQAELSIKEGGEFVDAKYVGGHFVNVDELVVPKEHTDHSTFIRYEGPGWESDKVGYRFYLDWRNAIDIFGKKQVGMVLQNVGQDGFQSYHEPADWGMDILKVGNSLGIGSLGLHQQGQTRRVDSTAAITCKILENGPIRAAIRTQYADWQVSGDTYNVTSTLSILAGSRATRHDVQIYPGTRDLCTGIAKHEGTQRFNYHSTGSEWSYLATWGPQSLAGDGLGLAIFFRTKDLVQVTDDDLNELIVLDAGDGTVTYYFVAAWQSEPQGVQTPVEFVAYLNAERERLNHPLREN